MKYEKINEDIEAEKGMDIMNVDDILEEEYLNCDLIPLSSESSSGSSESLNKSEIEICEKDCNSNSNLQGSITEKSDNSDSENIGKEDSETDVEEDVPVKLIVTYHFSFDTDENEEIENGNNVLKEESVTSTLIEGQIEEVNETSEHDNDDNDEFEDGSFCSEDEQDLLEYSSVKNGSKNNLLDESYGPELCYSVKNVCLVNLNPNQASTDPEFNYNSESNSVETDKVNDNIKDMENDCVNQITKCEDQTLCMRKNFIYYSSAVKLYFGELRYEDNFPEKKFKFARKIFKKVFPSQKYVVNN